MKTGIKNSMPAATYVMVAFACYASLWFGLGASRLWDRDEPRNARCAVEMLERNDWVVPYFNDQLRTHKPVLLYWMEMTAYQCFGENAFAARVPSAVMGTVTVIGIAILASSFLGRRAGLFSAGVLATCSMMVVASRAATPDASLICTSCWGVIGLVMHWRTKSTSRTVWWWVGFTSLGLAILAKGPVGIVLPSIVVGLWCVLQEMEKTKDFAEPMAQSTGDRATKLVPIARKAIAFGSITVMRAMRAIGSVLFRLHVLAGLVVALLIASPWYVWVGLRTDGEWLHGFFWEHNVSRAVHAMEGHRGGLWYYPAAALLGLFPWSLLLIPIVTWTWRALVVKTASGEQVNNENQESLRQLSLLGVLWIAVYIGCFSIARTKLPSYITPCYPGAALLIGGFLSCWSSGSQRISRSMLFAGGAVYAIAGIGLSAGLLIASEQLSIPSIRIDAIWPLVLLLGGVCMVWFANSDQQRRIPAVLVGSSAILIGGIFGATAPKIDSNRGDLNAMIAMDGQSKWLSVGTIEPSWVFYMRHAIEEIGADPANRKAILDRIASHLSCDGSRLLVRQDDWESHQAELEALYGLKTSTAATFPVFLKGRTLLVIERANGSAAKLSEHNSSNRR